MYLSGAPQNLLPCINMIQRSSGMQEAPQLVVFPGDEKCHRTLTAEILFAASFAASSSVVSLPSTMDFAGL